MTTKVEIKNLELIGGKSIIVLPVLGNEAQHDQAVILKPGESTVDHVYYTTGETAKSFGIFEVPE